MQIRGGSGTLRPPRRRAPNTFPGPLVRLPIRWKLILSIGLPLLAVYLIVLAVAYRTLRDEAVGAAETHVSDRALRNAAMLDGKLTTVEQVARTTAASLSTRKAVTPNELYARLRQNVMQNDRIY